MLRGPGRAALPTGHIRSTVGMCVYRMRVNGESVKFLGFVLVVFYGYFKIFDGNCVLETIHLYGRLLLKLWDRAKHVHWSSHSDVGTTAVLTSSLTELFVDNE